MANSLVVGVRSLVPENAARVKAAMARAAELSAPERTFGEAHFVATAHAVKVVVFSVFNSFVYVGWGVGSCTAHLWRNEVTKAFVVLGQGVSGAVRSVVLVFVGVVYVAGGFVFPRWVFLPFAVVRNNPMPPAPPQPPVDPNFPLTLTTGEPFLPPVSPTPPLLSRPPSTPIVSTPSLPTTVSAPRSTPSSFALIPSEPPIISSQPRKPLPVVRISPEARKHSPIVLDVQGIKQREMAQLVQWIAELQASRLPEPAAGLEGRGAGALIPIAEPVPVMRQQPRRWVLQVSDDQQILIDLDLIGRREIAELVRLLEQQRSVSGLPLRLEAPKEDGTKFVKISPRAAAHLPKGDKASFLTYVQRYSASNSQYVQTCLSLIAEGEKLVEAFSRYPANDPRAPEMMYPTAEERMKLISPVTWHLMFLAEIRYGKAFPEGMFVFQDPGHRMGKFFSLKVKSRMSTHFHGSRLDSLGKDIVQNGIDGLPAGHQTSHFGRLETLDPHCQYTFLKPETHGTESPLQMLGHGFSWAWTRLMHALGRASSAGQYKEHPPEKIKARFFALYKQIASLDENEKAKGLVNTFGIAWMMCSLRDHLKILKKGLDQSVSAQIRALMHDIAAQYDCLLVRKGEEVILEKIHLPLGDPVERLRLQQTAMPAAVQPVDSKASEIA